MRRLLRLLILALPCACTTAPPPATLPPPAESILSMLTISTDNVRVYAAPAASAPLIGSLRTGDRLALIERQAEWLFVKTPDGVRGYVREAALAAAECTTDRAAPLIVEEPLFRFDSEPPHGRVVVEAEYTADGRLAGTRLVENTVGDPRYAQRALDDLRTIRFLPPTEDCQPRPFFYTFTRQF